MPARNTTEKTLQGAEKAQGGTGHLPANERAALRQWRAAKKLAAENGLPEPPKPQWKVKDDTRVVKENVNYGGTGHLPANERAKRRAQRAAMKAKARAMSDNEGAEPTLPETLAAIMEALKGIDARMTALEGKKKR